MGFTIDHRFVKSVDDQPNDSKSRSSLVGVGLVEMVFVMSRATKVCQTQSQVLYDVVWFTQAASSR